MKQVVLGAYLLKNILIMKSMYSSYLIDKQVKHFLYNRFFTQNENKLEEFKTYFYHKTPHKDSFSNRPKNQARVLCKKVYNCCFLSLKMMIPY